MIFGFLLTIAFVPIFPGAGTTPRWLILSLLLPLLALGRDVRPTLGHALLGLFIGYAGLSLLWAPDRVEGLNDLWKLCILGAAFVVGAQQKTLKPVFAGAAIAMGINSLLVIAQAFWSVSWVPQTVAPAGLFVNKNVGAEAAMLILIGAVGYRVRWALLATLPTILLSNAKGALIAAIVVAVWALRGWQRWVAFYVLATIAAAVFFLAGMQGVWVSSLRPRIDLWLDMLGHLSFLGSGAGSFYTARTYLLTNVGAKEFFDFAHNDVLQLVFEFGIGAVPLIILAALAFRGTQCRVAQAVLLAFAVEGCFGFPFHVPVTSALALLCAGHVYGRSNHLRNTLPSGQFVLRRGLAGI